MTVGTDRGSGFPFVAPFVAMAGRGIAKLGADLDAESLTLTLSLSTWIRRAVLTDEQAFAELLELRLGLLAAAGMDPLSEPVPLRGRDRRRNVLNVAVYLGGLIERAASVAGLPRSDVVEQALGGCSSRIEQRLAGLP